MIGKLYDLALADNDGYKPASPEGVDKDVILSLLKDRPIFRNWTKDQLIEIIPFMHHIHFSENDVIHTTGEAIDNIYFVFRGCLTLADKSYTGTTAALGLEGLFSNQGYKADVIATENTDVYAMSVKLFPQTDTVANGHGQSFLRQYFERPESISQDEIDDLMDLDPDEILAAYSDTPQPVTESPPVQVDEPKPEKKEKGSTATDFKDSNIPLLIGWFIAFLTPTSVWIAGQEYGLLWSQNYYLTILSGCLVLLLLDLVPQYAAVLAAALASLLLDIVPDDVILSGFASGGFFMALSIFGLGSVLVRAGLATRLVLFILRHCPSTRFFQNLAVLIVGILMTPCLPSANARVKVLAPLIQNTSRSVGYKDRSREATQLMLSMFVGCTLFAPVFLTSKSLNFVLYDMLPQQVSTEYQWLNWLYSAAGTGLAILVLYLVITTIIFRGGQEPVISKSHLDAQLEVKGSLDNREWIALIGITLFIIAVTNYSFHKVSLFWVGFGFFCIFLIIEALSDDHIGKDIEWDALLLIGFFIGLENALDHTGISVLITNLLTDVTSQLDGDYYLFLLFNIALIGILRIFLPITTTGVLAASVSFPLANVYGFNPWLTGFIILNLTECWIWPKQASYYGTYVDACNNHPIHDLRLFKRINLITITIRIVVLFALVFVMEWKQLL